MTDLPRLLYVGDVPVESSYHGSALLYRLLQEYPSHKLLVVEAETHQSLPARRLPDVPYRTLPAAAMRLCKTRFSRLAGSWLTVTPSISAMRLRRVSERFGREAVLTVAHGYSWLAAARLAETARLPLHLIVHDHWPEMTSVWPWLKGMQDRQFGKVYRQAASRLCVSPFMEEDYRRRYGVEGQVLYPSRAKDCPLFDRAPATYAKDSGPLIGAYAGNIFCAGYARLIATLADALDRRGGRLLLFGPHSREQLTAWGLNRPNVLLQGLVASGDLVSRLRNEADFVFVPMTFDSDGSQHNMRISFPSKITDYTATGLPLLICGPDYCSAVRWAQRHGEIAEVVTTQAADGIDAAVHRLEQRQYRERMGQAAMQLGNDLFSHRAAVDILYGVMMTGRSVIPSDGRSLPDPSTR